MFHEECGNFEEIKERTKKKICVCGKAHELVKSNNVSRNAKVREYKRIIRLTITKACKTWALTKYI